MNDRSRSTVPGKPPDTLLGRVLNDCYRIDSVVARGGMGCVYRAYSLTLGQQCALKVVTKDDLGAQEGDFVERFVREATTTARLRHRHCVSVLDFGETSDGILYLAMELLKGTTLADALRSSGPFTVHRFVHVARQVCEGVAAAHQLGIVHRDLKSANIFLSSGVDGEDDVKVLDFGIAKRLHDTSLALTRPGQMLGTPKYMAPEQILGRAVDIRADVYSLGIVFYEMLTGRVPFDRDNFLDVLAGHAHEPVPMMTAVNPDVAVSPDLEAMVQRMLAKEPADRYPNLSDVLRVLAGLELDMSTAAPTRVITPSQADGERLPSHPASAGDRDAPTRVSRVPSVFPPARTAPTRPVVPAATPAASERRASATLRDDRIHAVAQAPRVVEPTAQRQPASRSRRATSALLIAALGAVAVGIALWFASGCCERAAVPIDTAPRTNAR